MKALSLFSGIGGLDLAAEAAGIETVAFCEREPFCQDVLHTHWPDVPIHDDVFSLKGEDIGTVDIIHGGFPCQPFSVAGRQRGQDDERYLWPEFSRLVGEIRPRWVVAENVLGIMRLAADDVCKDLESLGYNVGIWSFEAASVGALHHRGRVFFVGHSKCVGQSRVARRGTGQVSADGREDAPEIILKAYGGDRQDVSSRAGNVHHSASERQRDAEAGDSYRETTSQTASAHDERSSRNSGQGDVPDAEHDGSPAAAQYGRAESDELSGAASGEKAPEQSEGVYPNAKSSADDESELRNERRSAMRDDAQVSELSGDSASRLTAQSGLGRVAYGFPRGVDLHTEPDIPRTAQGVKDRAARLKALGNAVVPAQAYPIFKAIVEIEEATK